MGMAKGIQECDGGCQACFNSLWEWQKYKGGQIEWVRDVSIPYGNGKSIRVGEFLELLK